MMPLRDDIDISAEAERVIRGEEISQETAHAILAWPDARLDELLDATLRIREAFFGRRVKLCMLRNARSGICPEDCHYCSQSRISRAPIPVYRLQPASELVEGARRAVDAGARRYCMVTSGRGPEPRDLEVLGEACERIAVEFPQLEICLSLGIMDQPQAAVLKRAGAGWINHNLNTSRRFYPQICSTHSWDDRVRTIENVRGAGLKTCAGGIIGMGESDEDVIELARTCRHLGIDSVPVNFLHPIAGTPLGQRERLSPQRCLKALCLFRFLNPSSELRAAGGRELNLGDYQGRALCAANSVFVDGYLTTSGLDPERTRELILRAGFEPEPGFAVAGRAD